MVKQLIFATQTEAHAQRSPGNPEIRNGHQRP